MWSYFNLLSQLANVTLAICENIFFLGILLYLVFSYHLQLFFSFVRCITAGPTAALGKQRFVYNILEAENFNSFGL